jgi:hypothetical protein
MNKKIASIEKNDTWKLVPKLKEKKPIDVKWIFKEKNNVKREVKRYKARLVVKDYNQKHNIDYNEVFALVARLETIRFIIVTIAQYRWRIYQIDVKSSFFLMVFFKIRSTLSNLWNMKWRDIKTMY